MGGAGNPWAWLRSLPDVKLRWRRPPQGGAQWQRRDGRDEVLIDPAASRVERNHLLAHELRHVSRGIGYPHATPATMQLEEERIRRADALYLVPPCELDPWIRHQLEVEGCVLPLDVAERWEVPVSVAVKALELARRRVA